MSTLRRILHGHLLALGAVALVMLGSSSSERPLLCLVQVEGESMSPTLHADSQIIVLRAPFRVGSIVLADAGEDELVVKRVVARTGKAVVLRGDNRGRTLEYRVPQSAVRGIMVCRSPFTSPWHQERPSRFWDLLGATGYAEDLE